MRYLLPTARPIAEDLAGTLAFYLLYLITGSALLGLAAGMAIGLTQMARHRQRGERVPTLLAMGVLLTVMLGGVSMVLHDVRVVLLKPSIVYACIGTTMLPRGWVTRYVPPVAHDLLPAATFDRVGWGWAALMFATAALNLLLVATLAPRDAAGWLLVLATGAKLLLFAGQYAVLRRRAGQFYLARQHESHERN